MNSRLKYFSISFFTIILGLSGLAIAANKVETNFNIPHISSWLGFGTFALYILFFIIYFARTIIYTKEVAQELKNPIKRNFFPTVSISLILLSIVFLNSHETLSKYMLLIGMIVHFIFHNIYNVCLDKTSKYRYKTPKIPLGLFQFGSII